LPAAAIGSITGAGEDESLRIEAMRILAMDTAANACSAALWRGAGIAARRLDEMSRGQAEALVPMIAEVLAEAEVEVQTLDLIAVTVGPGAFTGVRIGLATARAMGLAAGVPVLGVTTFEAIVHGAGERAAGSVLAALDSKRADIYAQAFAADLTPLGAALAIAPEALAGIVGATPLEVVGDAAIPALAALGRAGIAACPSPAPGFPDAAAVAEIASLRWRLGQELPPPRPLYLRPPDAIPAKPRPGAAP